MHLQLGLALPDSSQECQSYSSTGVLPPSFTDQCTDEDDTASTDHTLSQLALRQPSGNVKAQMEGVVITRKVDLTLHRSYHTLVPTLMFMFGKGEVSSNAYILTYQDREGDWFLAAGVPWRRFENSVQRIRLIKKEG